MKKTFETVPEKLGFFVFALFYAAVWFILLRKCRYGVANFDEAFYLTIPYRLCQGDQLLVHEWNLSQLSAPLLFLPFKIYLLLFGGTDGIFFAFRRLFVLLWGGGGIILFSRLRRISVPGAMAAALVFLIFTPNNIMALSYFSMGILAVSLSAVLVCTARRFLALQYALAGILFSAAVLCCPYLAGFFVLFSLWALWAFLRRREQDASVLYAFRWFLLGVGISAAVFLAFFFPRVPLKQMLASIPWILKDPEHESQSLIQKTVSYFSCVFTSSSVAGVCCAAAVAVPLFARLKKKPAAGFVVECIVCAGMLASYHLARKGINYLMFPLSFLGLYCRLNSDDPQIRRVFRLIWIPGAVYSFCLHLASNQFFYAVSAGATVMAIASALVAFRFLAPYRQAGKLRAVLIASLSLLVVLQLGTELTQRWQDVYWETGIADQTEWVDYGPDEGLFVSPKAKLLYDRMEADIAAIREMGEVKSVLFLAPHTWPYLSAEKDFGTYSAWLSKMSKATLERLDAYYSLNPEKQPDLIYIIEPYQAYVGHFEAMGYRVEKEGVAGFFLRLFR